MASCACLHGRQEYVTGLHALGGIVASDAGDILVIAMQEHPFGQPPCLDFRSNNPDRGAASGHFVTIPASVKRRRSTAWFGTAIPAEENRIFKGTSRELPFLEAPHFSLDKCPECAALRNATNFFAIILVLLRQTSKECLHERHLPVRQP